MIEPDYDLPELFILYLKHFRTDANGCSDKSVSPTMLVDDRRRADFFDVKAKPAQVPQSRPFARHGRGSACREQL